MQQPSVAAAKHLLRIQHLKALRAAAKEDVSKLRRASMDVCEHLTDYTRRTYGLSGTSAASPPPPLYVCAYLPLYYEVDLVPYLQQLWGTRGADPAGDEGEAGRVCVMVPTVVEPPRHWSAEDAGQGRHPSPPWYQPYDTALQRLHSAMVFVEVLGPEDFFTHFRHKGTFNIMELSERAFSELFVPRGDSACPAAGSQRPRRVLTCDQWDTLFPAHARPPGLVDIHSELAPTNERGASLLVLTPGVAFCAKNGARLGKGGGFYDRFLQYIQSGDPRTLSVCVMGVGLDSQVIPEDVLPEEQVPMGPSDVPITALLTPSGGIVAVGS